MTQRFDVDAVLRKWGGKLMEMGVGSVLADKRELQWLIPADGGFTIVRRQNAERFANYLLMRN